MKVSGSNPIQPIFFFGRKNPFSETHFCFQFFYRIILFWIISLFFYFIFHISFVLQYFIHFISADTYQRNLVALLSESLDSASGVGLSLAKDNWPLSFVDDYVDLPVLPLNTMDVTHEVFPLG